MDTATHTLGRSGLEVTPLTLGAWKWGYSPFSAAADQSDQDGRIETLADAFFAGELASRVLDTSNIYGRSRSEVLIGAAIRRAGGIPAGIVVQTKLDRDPETQDFSAARMERSLAESLARLGVPRLQMLYLHDPEHIGFEAAMAPGGPVQALVAMREAGLAESIGISGGPLDMLESFVRTDLFDALISHNRYTLVDRSADALYNLAAERGVGVMNAAPYGAGVLTGHPRYRSMYAYDRISPQMSALVGQIERLCQDAGVPMATVALQFSVRAPHVDSTIVGVSDLDRARGLADRLSVHVPDALWLDIDELAATLAP